jgi:hypothetical protein
MAAACGASIGRGELPQHGVVAASIGGIEWEKPERQHQGVIVIQR